LIRRSGGRAAATADAIQPECKQGRRSEKRRPSLVTRLEGSAVADKGLFPDSVEEILNAIVSRD
jgi:hypothetical protein